MRFEGYDPGTFYDELFAGPGRPRPEAAEFVRRLDALPPGDLERRQRAVEAALLRSGITFTVYGDTAGTERIFPFDIVPRFLDGREWDRVADGLRQRVLALNAFIADVYGDQRIFRDGAVPAELIGAGSTYRPQMAGFKPPRGIWCHITGTDLVRDSDGTIYVLEDNLRCPSGVSYMLANRRNMKHTFPQLFQAYRVRAVDDYPDRLLQMLHHLAPDNVPDPSVVVLTPGPYNSAYFEHAFLAQQMGVELVQNSDLVVSDGRVRMRTTRGLERVDVIYRRIDDDFLDPLAFRADSALGVPGLMEVYRAGRVALANAPGTGVADDKVIYAYVPKMIRYYLGEEPIVANVPTYVCLDEKDRQYVLEHLETLVVKPAHESGGYGMLMGPASTAAQRAEFAALIRKSPRNYVAQPVLSLSVVPTLCGENFAGRHVDLRPYVLYGSDIYVTPGGLTRVALRPGSLIVNSSQGGGSKDTWVVDRPENGAC